MKNILTIILIISAMQFTFSQDSGISAEVFYPIQKPTEYQGDLTGILGIAFQFQFTDNPRFNFGAEYRYEMIQGIYHVSENTDPTRKTYSFNNLGAYTKINPGRDDTFQLYLGSGVDIFNLGTGGKRKYFGYYASGGFQFNLMDQWYLFTAYQWSKAKKSTNSGDYTFKEQLSTFRFGVGFNF